MELPCLSLLSGAIGVDWIEVYDRQTTGFSLHSITGNVSGFGVGVLMVGRARVDPCRYFAGQVPGRSVKFAADP